MALVIHTTAELADFCASLCAEPYLALDTEFLRERTYWPKLCLVQVAGASEAAAIDPLAEGIDLQPLWELLQNTAILKVFHAGQQDLEIIHHLTGHVPQPLYDTQAAAMVLGYGEQVGYEALVKRLLEQSLDKSQRFTDWSRRPLSEAQLDYALGDVTHLRGIYEALTADIKARGRESWIEEELTRLSDPALYVTHPEDAWLRLKKRDRRPQALARMQALAAWRERTAIAQNKPRGWVLSDEAVQEIAATNPKDATALKKLRSIGKYLRQLDLGAVLEVLATANALPKSAWPKPEVRQALPAELEPAKDLLKLLLKQTCQEHQVTPKLVANSQDLTALLEGDTAVPLLHGWRYDVFGKQAEALLAGALTFSLDGDTRQVTFSGS